ncbi:hypothetical protein [Streptococcus sanguinis]|jgi:hypothetical protein|uniref:hypothetical protein n=1 Tax=Streptococcus sanguinis TaxID=1305 RepID=UPI000779A04F|nr:hypothetical protein [Streptococcus sanguinis]
MEKRLRLFHFSKDQYGEPYYLPGIIFDNSFAEFSKIVEDLDSRINKCVDDKYAKNFRFKIPSSQIVTNVSEIFENEENFDRNSEDIASKFKESIKRRFKNDFYLVVLTTEIDSREILFLVKMETGTAIQVTDENTLTTLDKILPDKKSRLQKATVIYKDKTIQFKENREEPDSERTNIHSRVLDRTDDNISGYFFKVFLDSDNVIDDEDSAARMAIQAIDTVVKPYIKPEKNSGVVKDRLISFLSQRRDTSFEGLIQEVSDLLDFDKEDRETDVERLSNEAYELAKGKNNTVVASFVAKLYRPPKVTYVAQGDEQQIKISFLKSLENHKDVYWDDDDDDFYVLKINKEVITLIER